MGLFDYLNPVSLVKKAGQFLTNDGKIFVAPGTGAAQAATEKQGSMVDKASALADTLYQQKNPNASTTASNEMLQPRASLLNFIEGSLSSALSTPDARWGLDSRNWSVTQPKITQAPNTTKALPVAPANSSTSKLAKLGQVANYDTSKIGPAVTPSAKLMAILGDSIDPKEAGDTVRSAYNTVSEWDMADKMAEINSARKSEMSRRGLLGNSSIDDSALIGAKLWQLEQGAKDKAAGVQAGLDTETALTQIAADLGLKGFEAQRESSADALERLKYGDSMTTQRRTQQEGYASALDALDAQLRAEQAGYAKLGQDMSLADYEAKLKGQTTQAALDAAYRDELRKDWQTEQDYKAGLRSEEYQKVMDALKYIGIDTERIKNENDLLPILQAMLGVSSAQGNVANAYAGIANNNAAVWNGILSGLGTAAGAYYGAK